MVDWVFGREFSEHFYQRIPEFTLLDVDNLKHLLYTDFLGFGATLRSCMLSKLIICGSLAMDPATVSFTPGLLPHYLDDGNAIEIYPKKLARQLKPLVDGGQTFASGFQLILYLMTTSLVRSSFPRWSSHSADLTLYPMLQTLKDMRTKLKSRCETADMTIYLGFPKRIMARPSLLVTEAMMAYDINDLRTAIREWIK